MHVEQYNSYKHIPTFDVHRDPNDLQFTVHSGVSTSVHSQIDGKAAIDCLQCMVVSDVKTSVAISVNIQDSNVYVIPEDDVTRITQLNRT